MDQRSFRHLDLWLEQVDTNKTIKNFETGHDLPDRVLGLQDLNLSNESAMVQKLLRHEKPSRLSSQLVRDVGRALEIAWQANAQNLVNELFSAYVEHSKSSPLFRTDLVAVLIRHLERSPGMVIHFLQLAPWSTLDLSLTTELRNQIPQLLRAVVLCTDKKGTLALQYFNILLMEVQTLSIDDLRQLVELIALTFSSVETAMDILSERLEPSLSKIMLIPPKQAQYLMGRLTAIAIDHIEEAIDSAKDASSNVYQWKFDENVVESEGDSLLTVNYRIDAPSKIRLATGDHIRFHCTHCPTSVFASQLPAFEVLVRRVEVGRVTFACLRYPPAILQQCLWHSEHCGSFVTAQTMIDAVTCFVSEKVSCCQVYKCLMGDTLADKTDAQATTDLSELNSSQQEAVLGCLQTPVSNIWGPPGTGKTQTVVAIINEILSDDSSKRLLVTAPTHNAVDNVLRRFLQCQSKHDPVRVSTDVGKVSSDLRFYTCDAMLGKDINQHPSARRKAQKQISQARLVFTTCIGAGLGLLRGQRFDNVIIDEASQQTEPASLVPIVKGCSRLVLVGDHVQLRATVHPHATALGHDVSLFEKLWVGNDGVGKIMLDTQYRMHPKICGFPSNEFYDGKLKSHPKCETIKAPFSRPSWLGDYRLVFVQISDSEDLGRKSKSNAGQAKVSKMIVTRLRDIKDSSDFSIAILTPYTRQVDLLKAELTGEMISSIDGFQGQEADVIVYVSVRCNVHGEIGFLKDLRRLNVALTRARAGIIVIGDESTLVGNNKKYDNDEQMYHLTWRRLIETCHKVNADDILKCEPSPGAVPVKS